MRGGIGPEPEEPKARKLSYKEPQGHDQNSN
jgi:hypothetical protein